MKVKEERKFIIELNDAELNQFFDWLKEHGDKNPKSTSHPKIIDEMIEALFGYRHGV